MQRAVGEGAGPQQRHSTRGPQVPRHGTRRAAPTSRTQLLSPFPFTTLHPLRPQAPIESHIPYRRGDSGYAPGPSQIHDFTPSPGRAETLPSPTSTLIDEPGMEAETHPPAWTSCPREGPLARFSSAGSRTGPPRPF